MATGDVPGVGQRLGLSLLAVGLLLAGVLGIGVVGTLVGEHYTGRMSTGVQPALEANYDLTRAVLAADQDLRSWTLTGDPADLRRHRDDLLRLARLQRSLARHARGLPDVAALLPQQEAAIARWERDYAVPRAARAPGLDPGRNAGLAVIGDSALRDFRHISAEVDAALDRETAQSQARLHHQEAVLLGLQLLIVLAGLLMTGLLARRLLRDVRDPLERLEGVVRRLAAGQHDVRAEESGPREVRQVAWALNRLADASSRARSMEQSLFNELRALDRTRGDLVSNVSHELRTPIASISAYVEVLEQETTSEEHRAMLSAVRRNTRRLATLVDDLLALARAEEGTAQMERLDLVAIAEDVIGDLRLSAGRRNITLRLEDRGGPAFVLGHAGSMTRAVSNLVSNAIKFSHPDSVVVVVVEATSEQVSVDVVDHGIGIPEHDQGAIGARFFRGSNAGHVPGTGLGLRIVQTIVHRHQGRLRLTSVEGHGTTASISLPPYTPDVTPPRQREFVPDA